MWIKINKDVFEESDINGLSYIFQILSWFPKSISRYNVFVDIDEIKATDNYKKLKVICSNFDELLEQQFNDFVLVNSKRDNIDYSITRNKNENCFNIEESIRFFSQPISIILENNKNDSFFINTIINHFDTTEVLKEHIENGWIKFENAGGCSNVKNFIDGELKSFEDLASRNNRDMFDYYKAFVVLDSDKEYENQSQKQQYNILIKFLNSINIDSTKYHILSKRMMENYMPDEVFDEIFLELSNSKDDTDLKKWINVYKVLSSSQKDYLKYYDGFSSNFDDLIPEVKAIYENQQGVNFEILRNGFKYKGKSFKNEFPLKFSTSSRVNKHTLENRANSNELKEVLDKITKLI